MHTTNNQQNSLPSLPANGSVQKFDSAAFYEQLKKVKKLLTPEDLSKLKRDDREAEK